MSEQSTYYNEIFEKLEIILKHISLVSHDNRVSDQKKQQLLDTFNRILILIEKRLTDQDKANNNNEASGTITCPHCDGEGYVHYNPEKFGNEMFECEECDGAGEITEKEYFEWLIDHVKRHTKRCITIVLEDGQIVK